MIGETYVAPAAVIEALWNTPQTEIRRIDGHEWKVTAKPEHHAVFEVLGIRLGKWERLK